MNFVCFTYRIDHAQTKVECKRYYQHKSVELKAKNVEKFVLYTFCNTPESELWYILYIHRVVTEHSLDIQEC